MAGLVKGDCEHDRSSYETTILGIEYRKCLDCGEVIQRYHDVGQGG
jgi:hypothetical protein